MDDSEYIKIGDKIIKVFKLRIKTNGRVDTIWGDKTPLGLAKTIERIFEESKNDFKWFS